MIERSVPPAGDPIYAAGTRKQGGDASPHVPTVDDRYARLLADDLDVKLTTARTAFIGEPVARALSVREWAFERAPESPEKRAKLVLGWAKRREAGAFRPDDGDDTTMAGILDRREPGERERFVRLAEALARMWVEHPESLAEAVRALEQSRVGRS